MKKFESFPPGVQAFAKKIKAKTDANINEWDCDRCGKKVFIAGPGEVSMHVLVLPDKDHTTMGLCKPCIIIEADERGITLPTNPRASFN